MKLLLILLSFSFLIIPFSLEASVLPACTATGNCGICDFLDTFINIINWLLGAIGGVALFLFAWHGFGLITSAGGQEKITAARKGLTNTILGVIIVLAAWFLVYVITGILLSTPGEADFKQSLFNSNRDKWYVYCGGNDLEICIGRGIGSPCGGGNFCYPVNNTVLKCVNSAKINTDVTAENACEYWANRPIDVKEGFSFNPYSDYKCLQKSLCDPYENLGGDYCRNANFECCQQKPTSQNTNLGTD